MTSSSRSTGGCPPISVITPTSASFQASAIVRCCPCEREAPSVTAVDGERDLVAVWADEGCRPSSFLSALPVPVRSPLVGVVLLLRWCAALP